MKHLERLLQCQNIAFSYKENHVRYWLSFSFSSFATEKLAPRCFPHIVNLACKAVLTSITNMEYASEQATEYVLEGMPADSVMNVIDRDPIATLRSLIRTVCIWCWRGFERYLTYQQIRSSSLRRHAFSTIVKALNDCDYQLLRDMDVCWSSTLLMIDCGLFLKQVNVETFITVIYTLCFFPP